MAQSFAFPFFMAPSDSQHPEIRFREEKRKKRWRKQNQTNIGSFTRTGRGLSSQGGRDDAGGATAEKASKKKENEEKLILKY